MALVSSLMDSSIDWRWRAVVAIDLSASTESEASEVRLLSIAFFNSVRPIAVFKLVAMKLWPSVL